MGLWYMYHLLFLLQTSPQSVTPLSAVTSALTSSSKTILPGRPHLHMEKVAINMGLGTACYQCKCGVRWCPFKLDDIHSGPSL